LIKDQSGEFNGRAKIAELPCISLTIRIFVVHPCLPAGSLAGSPTQSFREA
jgi:hypothetical protein